MQNDDARAGAPEVHHAALLFNAELAPSAPLSRGAARLVLLIALAASVVISIVLAYAGAWPVVGFFGLDIFALWLALRLSARAARMREYVRVTAEEIAVDRAYPSGRVMSWRVPSAWARVQIERRGEHDAQVRLWTRQAGERPLMLVLGSFLPPIERGPFADALAEAVARAQRSRPAHTF